MGFYKYMQSFWKKPDAGVMRVKYMAWRREPVVLRIDNPTRLDRAHALGYKAKQGIIVARTRVKKGGMTRPIARRGRKPSKAGMKKYSAKKSKQQMAEERVNKKYPNMEVLNSYWVGDDGVQKFYEVILVDPHSPSVMQDKDLNWICGMEHSSRAFRGLTSSGKKSRDVK